MYMYMRETCTDRQHKMLWLYCAADVFCMLYAACKAGYRELRKGYEQAEDRKTINLWLHLRAH